MFAGAQRCFLVSYGKASKQGFGAEGEVQESLGAGIIPGKFKVIRGQANGIHHHCRNTQGVRNVYKGVVQIAWKAEGSQSVVLLSLLPCVLAFLPFLSIHSLVKCM